MAKSTRKTWKEYLKMDSKHDFRLAGKIPSGEYFTQTHSRSGNEWVLYIAIDIMYPAERYWIPYYE